MFVGANRGIVGCVVYMQNDWGESGDASVRSRDTSLCLIILSNIRQSATSPYIKKARKVATLEKFIFHIGTLNPRGINQRFSFN